MRRDELRSALVTFGGGALLVAAVALGLFVRARNLTAQDAMERGALSAALDLARDAGRQPERAVAAAKAAPDAMPPKCAAAETRDMLSAVRSWSAISK